MPDTRADPASASAPGADQPRVWLVMGEKLGDNAQVETIAAALDWPCERRILRFKAPWVTGKPPFRASLYHVDEGASDALAPPWPDLVLTVGRRPSMAAMWIKEQSGGRTRVAIVGRPRRMLRQFDLVLATPQYRLPDRPNVLRLDLPLMRVDPAKLAAGAEAWRERLAMLPHPLTAVLVGGATKPFVFDGAVARDLIASLRAAAGDDGTLFVTTSRRTAPDVVEALAAGLPASGRMFRWEAGAVDNPYHGLLALADRFVVTGDSISMMVEVARLGRPLAIFPLPVEGGPWPRLKKRLARVFQPDVGSGSGRGRPGPLVRLGDSLYDLGLIGYSREFEGAHRALIDRGSAVYLGRQAGWPAASVPDDIPRVVERLHGLLGPS